MSTESAKALRRIKALATSERHPHWDTDWAVTNSRGLIADECDRALSEPAAPSAPSVPPETRVAVENYALIRQDVVNFLRGVSSLNGQDFSEREEQERGRYWWRKFLPPSSKADDEEVRLAP